MHRPHALLLLLIPALAIADGGSIDQPAVIGLGGAAAQLLPASADGHYRVRADVRVSDSAKSLDGRYQVKSTAATCDPQTDSMFRNGFEQPL